MYPIERLTAALDGRGCDKPVFCVYDAFVANPSVDWHALFARGLVMIDHVDPIRTVLPDAVIGTSVRRDDAHEHTDIQWTTPLGTLQERFVRPLDSPLLPWRLEHLIKSPDDYRIMARALQSGDNSLSPSPSHMFVDPEARGIPAESVFRMAHFDRTPLQKIQIDWVGLERFAIDLFEEEPALMELLALMKGQILDRAALMASQPMVDVKLWENLSIEVLGPSVYERYLVDVYSSVLDVLHPAGKRLHVHYDGKLRLVLPQVAALGFDGIDSFSAGPEGDVPFAEAQRVWPGAFLWVHPSPAWFASDPRVLLGHLDRLMESAVHDRYCFVISEDVPPHAMENLSAALAMLA